MSEEYEDIQDQQQEVQEHPEEEVEEQPEASVEEQEEQPQEEEQQQESEQDTKDEDWGGADEEREVKKDKKKGKHREEVAKLYRRIQEEQAEKARVLAEIQRYREEADYYRSMSDTAQTALAKEHQTSSDQFYLRAERELREAHESQDVDAITKAYANFTDAAMRKQKADEIKIQHEFALQRQHQELAYQQQLRAQDPKIVNRIEMEVWKLKNPWIDQKQPSAYNKYLADAASARAKELTDWASSEGIDPTWVYSREFFQELDSHVHAVREQLQQQSRRNPPMNRPKGNPSPVRGSAYPSGNAKEPLSEADKRLFKKMSDAIPGGLKLEHFEKGKKRSIEDQKRGRPLISSGGIPI